ncbi:MAG: hypothetical protein Q8R37_00925 [Nanoarchaeota archaeon]|nr:hypothetical protein [Nanoarchaeota archaeon]
MLRTYLLSLISSGIIRDQQSMTEFFRKTFWAQQYNDFEQLQKIMDRMLSLLTTWGFVQGNDDLQQKQELFVSAGSLTSKISTGKLQATVVGKRISELYIDPLTADHILQCLQNFSKEKNTFSVLQMISYTLEMRPLLRVKAKETDQIQEELVKLSDLLLHPEPSAFDLNYEEFINSIKTALFFESWINEKDEDYLLETFDVRPGEIRVKQETADWLLYASEELAQILQYREAVKEIKKLRIRIQHGVKEDLLPLLQLKGIGRIRARKLVTNSIKSLGDLKKIDLTTLSQILGQKVAADVKVQLGQEIKEVPKGTRKGQLSLEKF